MRARHARPMSWRWHLHRSQDTVTRGPFTWHTCRCGLVKIVWRRDDRTTWVSGWATEEEAAGAVSRRAEQPRDDWAD
jgi:hypothetical protein